MQPANGRIPAADVLPAENQIKPASDSKQKYLYAAIIFVLTALTAAMLLHNGQDWGDDFSQYISQGLSLLDGTFGEWAAANRFIVANSPAAIAVPLYPWGYRLLLAAIASIFGANLLTFKIVQVILLALSAVLFYFLCDRLLPPKLSFVAGICYGVNWSMLLYANSIVSEPLFFVLELLFFLVLQNWSEHPQKRLLYGVTLGIVGFLAYLTRSQGINLFLALFGYQAIAFLLQKRRQTGEAKGFYFPSALFADKRAWIANIMPYAVFAALLLLSKAILPQSDASSLYFLEHVTIGTLWDNFLTYLGAFRMLYVFPWELETPFCILFFALIALGLVKRAGKSLPLLLFAIITFAQSVVFPWTQGSRYLLPLLPMFAIYTLYGIDALLSMVRLPKAVLAILSVLACLAFGGASVAIGAQNLRNNRVCDDGPYTEQAQAAFAYIREELPSDAVVAFFKPRLLYMETKQPCYRAGNEAETLLLADYLLYAKDVDYVKPDVLNASIERYNQAGGAIMLEPVYENDRFCLYSVSALAA